MSYELTALAYPRHDIDPKEKNEEWGTLYAKAAWHDWSYTIPRTVFYNAADKYEELRLYALGKQPINMYKKLMGVDEQTNNTWLNIDWSVRPIIPKFRDIAVSRLCQQEYNVVATPIDPQAKSELDQFYTQMKAKIAVRQLMEKQDPELAQHPLLMRQTGEPYDMEELEMRMAFGEQFNRAKDAEMAIQLAFYENGSKEFRRRMFETYFDCGVSGYKEWLGEDGRPKFRLVNPEAVVTNYCRFPDFRDLVHAGEVIDVSLIDLAEIKNPDGSLRFSEKDIESLATSVAGKWNNPSLVGRSTNYFRGYDKFKVKVLDFQFYSYNDYTYESNTNRRGNAEFNEAPYGKKNNKKEKYFSKRVKVVYEIKWIIGTDQCYDFRLMKDMKRSANPRKRAETTLGYKFYAPNFYEMRALSMMERLRPLADDYQMTCYKIQNFKNRVVPNGWWIDLDGLENVALSKGGEAMSPKDLLKMFMDTGVLVGRSKDIMGNNVNYKPIIPISNMMKDELIALYNDLSLTLQQMQNIIGLNELTDGSTPNAKTLNGVAEIAVASTNNALYPLQFGERFLIEKLADDMVLRTQQSLKRGNYDGYAPALNSNTLMFMSISPEMSMREYGIMLEERPNDDQKQVIMMMMQKDIAAGVLDTSDVFYATNMYSVKQAQEWLAWKVKKNKQAAELAKMQATQQTIDGQIRSAQSAEQAKQQTAMLQGQIDAQLEHIRGGYQVEVEKMRQETARINTRETNEAKIAQTVLNNESAEKQAASKPASAA